MCIMHNINQKNQDMHTLKKNIMSLRDELKPFVESERFDIEECLRLSRLLDEYVIGYMTMNSVG